MTQREVLRLERRGRVALLTLNRPEAHNAIDPEMACRLVEAFDAFNADPDLLVAVVTGAGDKAFCSGGDLATSLPLLTGARAAADDWDARVLADPDLLARAVLRRTDLEKPVVAAVNGYCLAGGMEFLLNTDIRIAAAHATFGLPEVRHGLIPFAGALARLAQQVPYCAAMEVFLTGEPIPAERALQRGLVNSVLPASEVLPEALRVADRIAGNGPLAVRQVKRTVSAGIGRTLEEKFALEDQARAIVMASSDAREGPRAFKEKRPPRFEGR